MINAMEWLMANLPEWPERKTQAIGLPSNMRSSWSWIADSSWCNGEYVQEIFLINTENGEFISSDSFYEQRYEQRLKPCGMKFSDLMEDLNEKLEM